MRKLQILFVTILVSLAGSPAFAASGGSPNGKPFVEINGQIAEVKGQIATLEQRMDNLLSRVSLNESRIDGVGAAIVLLQEESTELEQQMRDLEAGLTSAEDLIAQLEAANDSLQAELDEYGDLSGELALKIEANALKADTLTAHIDNGLAGLEFLIGQNSEVIAKLQRILESIETQLSLKQNILNSTCQEGYEVAGFEAGSLTCIKRVQPEGPITISQVIATRALALSSYWTRRSDSDLYRTIYSLNGSLQPSDSRGVKANQLRAGCPAGSYLMGGGLYEYPSHLLKYREGGDSGFVGNPPELRVTVDAINVYTYKYNIPPRYFLNPLWQPYTVNRFTGKSDEMLYFSAYLLCAGATSTEPL